MWWLILVQLTSTAAMAALLCIYVRYHMRTLHFRLTSLQQFGLNQRDIVASAHASAFLAARFPDSYMPISDFSMNPVNLQALLARVEELQPRVIVEIGCGQSTLLLGNAARAWGGRIVSFDQSESWLELCQRHAQAAGIASQISFHVLQDQQDITRIIEKHTGINCPIDMLVIDGPFDPDCIGAREREVRRILPVLSPTATIYLDDAQRPNEMLLLEHLRAEHSQCRIERRHSLTGFAFVTFT